MPLSLPRVPSPIRLTRGDALDTALAVGVAGFALADAVLGPHDTGVLDLGLLLASCAALVARSRAPLVVLAATLAFGLAYTLRTDPGPVATVPVLVALYTAVAAGHRIAAVSVAGPLLVFAVADNLASVSDLPTARAWQAAVLPVGWFVASVVLGEVTRQRRARLALVEARATEAERTREEVALRRAGEERLRIARDLHDSLTHQISVIKIQAEVAVHLARKRGEDVPDALLAVLRASRDASHELRTTLDVLHDDARPGLARLPELVRSASAAGVRTTVAVDGDTVPLPADVDATAYRIVQEALTNVARHAGTDTARVSVGYGDETVTVRIDDDGMAHPDSDPSPGFGLRGMRQRTAALGGTLRAQPRPNGGFTVEAVLPWERR
ncbi:sensor histidine kinase [Saccharomonospora piscinae]|uniref:sensor histidine kinase n=1 Tax=Saccharomonospora piscinae TaxID=687388 RepID=UPI001FC9D80E|nr:sensor histidine kinase [Saccharomonospora piscinae]